MPGIAAVLSAGSCVLHSKYYGCSRIRFWWRHGKSIQVQFLDMTMYLVSRPTSNRRKMNASSYTPRHLQQRLPLSRAPGSSAGRRRSLLARLCVRMNRICSMSVNDRDHCGEVFSTKSFCSSFAFLLILAWQFRQRQGCAPTQPLRLVGWCLGQVVAAGWGTS